LICQKGLAKAETMPEDDKVEPRKLSGQEQWENHLKFSEGKRLCVGSFEDNSYCTVSSKWFFLEGDKLMCHYVSGKKTKTTKRDVLCIANHMANLTHPQGFKPDDEALQNGSVIAFEMRRPPRAHEYFTAFVDCQDTIKRYLASSEKGNLCPSGSDNQKHNKRTKNPVDRLVIERQETKKRVVTRKTVDPGPASRKHQQILENQIQDTDVMTDKEVRNEQRIHRIACAEAKKIAGVDNVSGGEGSDEDDDDKVFDDNPKSTISPGSRSRSYSLSLTSEEEDEVSAAKIPKIQNKQDHKSAAASVRKATKAKTPIKTANLTALSPASSSDLQAAAQALAQRRQSPRLEAKARSASKTKAAQKQLFGGSSISGGSGKQLSGAIDEGRANDMDFGLLDQNTTPKGM
jgi:hypothetical protein